MTHNSWYEENFPPAANLTDCRNCLSHNPPTNPNTIFSVLCTETNTHVACSKARDCVSYSHCPLGPVEEPCIIQKIDVPENTEKDFKDEIMTLSEFFQREENSTPKEIEAPKTEEKSCGEQLFKPEVKEEKAEWKPSSQLDNKVFNFNDETLPAALRAMFDILKSVDKRLTEIEKKMPATKPWKIKNFFSKRKKSLVAFKNKYKYKIKNKIRKGRTRLVASFNKAFPKKKEDKPI